MHLNSLYRCAVQNFLSILYLRCTPRGGAGLEPPTPRTAFNSLFEMLSLAGTYQRLHRSCAFNSLFEMLYGLLALLGYCRVRRPFNSLFEMHV